MSSRPPYLRLALLALAAAGCFDAKPTEITGGGGVETTEGNLASLDAAPTGARVSLIPAEFDPLDDTLPDSLTVLADAEGTYRFRGLSPGRYNLEAYLPSAGTRCFRPGVVIAKGDKVIPGTDTLAAPGRLRLTWDGIDGGVLAQIGRAFRLDLSGLVPDSGGIILDSLPAGLLPPFTYVDPQGAAPRMLTDSVRIEPGLLATVPVLEAWAHSAILNWYAPSAPTDGLEGYPLLVRLARPAFPFEEVSRPGSDIRFTTLDGEPLPHAVDAWDSAAGQAEIWVRLKAQPGGGSGLLRMDWGRNPSVPTDSAAGPVFDSASGFAGVWHLARPASGGSGVLDDAGPFALRTSAVALTPEPFGAVGGAQRFDGVGSYASAAGGTPVDRPLHFYVSAWIAPDTTGLFGQGLPVVSRTVFSKWEETDSTGFILYYLPHFNGLRLVLGFGDTVSNFDLPYPKDSTGENWHLVAATYDGTDAALWWDGKELLHWGFGPGRLPANTRDILIGARASANPDTAVTDFFRGRMDEARVLLSVPPPAWLELDYQTQMPGTRIIGIQKQR